MLLTILLRDVNKLALIIGQEKRERYERLTR